MNVVGIISKVGSFVGAPNDFLSGLGAYVKFMYTKCADQFDNDSAYKQELFDHAANTNCD